MESRSVADARTALLRRAEETVHARRSAELEDLCQALEWCRLHADDPQARPGAVSVAHGGDHLTRLGGDGTPDVSELCAGELAVARQAGVQATQNLMADALDLAHRFPLTWARAGELVSEIWVLRRIAHLARRLNRIQVGHVDAAVSGAMEQAPGRLLALAEAAVIEADEIGHRVRLADAAARRGVWFPRPLPGDQTRYDGEVGLRRMAARLKPGHAADLDHTLDLIADHLADEHAAEADGELPSRDVLRAEALALLADPHTAAAVLDEAAADPEQAVVEHRPERKNKTRRRTLLVVHLADAAVARVEGIGAVLHEQLAELVAGSEITVLPVLDLNDVAAVDGYAHPAAMRMRTELRTAGDVFPHSGHRPGAAAIDHDHPVPYDPGGGPGQTSDLNDGPLTRRHHRIKTHLPYEVRQVGLGRYEWRTPHGLRRVVDRAGTHVVLD